MSQSSTPVAYDVAIVGAGMAGVAAAHALIAVGKRVVVLEARDRIGGRLLSVPTNSRVNLDLGATWFWANEPAITTLISDIGAPVFAQHLAGDAMYHDPKGSQRISGNPIDAPSGRFVNGADSLVHAIADRLPPDTVQLEQPVTSIDSSGDDLVVTTPSGQTSARHVVLAVPPALAVKRISFEPELDDRVAGLAAATPVWMGAIAKVVVRYANAFWREQGLAGAAISHFGPMREIHDMSGPDGDPAALFGFASPVTVGAPTASRDEVVQQLVQIFGPQASEPSEVIIQDWRAEEWTSPADVERLTAYQTYGHPLFAEPALSGRLHWASTETSTESPGHIEGALVAADRAARAIIQNA